MTLCTAETIPRAISVKVFDLMTLASAEGGEYVLGNKDLHIKSCYLIYGTLDGSEGGRLVKPGQNHDEILCAVGGPLLMHTTSGDISLPQGCAVHVKEDNCFFISNPPTRQVVYIISGGSRRPI